MRPEDKKIIAAHYGALCGLRSEADSDSDESSASKPSPKQEPASSAMPPPITPSAQRRPQSLTLPFENRERESHLVSEEEFDRIIRQEELRNLVPPLPTGVDCSTSARGLRTSISTAGNTRMSTMSQRPRPMSADFGRVIASAVGHHDQSQIPPSTLPRDPTLTALPRAPTKNDLMGCPADETSSPDGCLPGYASSLRKSSATSNSDRIRGKENGTHEAKATAETKGHKRHFSAADMFESVKKRLKLQNPHDAEYEQARAAINTPLTSSPAASTESRCEKYTADQNNSQVARGSSLSIDVARTPTTEPVDSLKKSLLKRTWSKTKHVAKLSIHSPGSKLKISDPVTTSISSTSLACSGRDTPTPVPSTMTTGTNATSQYYASAEPSSQPSHRPFTPTPSNDSGPLQQENYEFISGPAPRRGILTKLGAPPSRNELNTMVARQQSRIVDLTLQNNVLVNQIELLRSEVQVMKVNSNNNADFQGNSNSSPATYAHVQIADVPPSLRPASQAGDLQRVLGAESPLSRDEMLVPDACTTRPTLRQSRQSFDPEGWRRIIGVKVEREQRRQVHVDKDVDMALDADVDQDMDKEDKRKTWMTCDS